MYKLYNPPLNTSRIHSSSLESPKFHPVSCPRITANREPSSRSVSAHSSIGSELTGLNLATVGQHGQGYGQGHGQVQVQDQGQDQGQGQLRIQVHDQSDAAGAPGQATAFPSSGSPTSAFQRVGSSSSLKFQPTEGESDKAEGEGEGEGEGDGEKGGGSSSAGAVRVGTGGGGGDGSASAGVGGPTSGGGGNDPAFQQWMASYAEWAVQVGRVPVTS